MPENTSSGGSRFIALPSTSLGRVSAVLFLVPVVLIVLTSTVLDRLSLQLGNLNVFGALNFLMLLAALVTGAVALIRNHERSWAVWVATVLPAVVLGAEVISLLVPGN